VEGIVSDLLYLSRFLSNRENVLTNGLGSFKKVTRSPPLHQGSLGKGAEQKIGKEMLMEKKYVVALKDAVTGVLHGGGGTFRVLIDEESSGAKYFSCLVNTMNKGVKGGEHKHDVEHLWYILSGKGTMTIGGKTYKVGPEMAVFAPAGVLHRIDVDPGEDLTYVVVYAPPGPEQQLKQLGAKAFDQR
jgi:mannose-6-phosphate isomerase-like protein (cupin superfamily)